jgi:hypothetical protein
MAFEINNEILRNAIAARGLPPASENALHLFGIRGAVPWPDAPDDGNYYLTLKTNVADEWNDTIGTFGTAFCAYKATVDPGLPYTQDPLHPMGCAHLEDGRWQYCLGDHKGHEALVQAAPVSIWRDLDGDTIKDGAETEATGYFGINIHSGEGDSVGDWSAGCQVLVSRNGWDGPEWTTFLDTVKASGQGSWYYFLLEAADVAPGD